MSAVVFCFGYTRYRSFLFIEPEELGAKLLFLAKEEGRLFSLLGFEHGIWDVGMRDQPTYPGSRKAEVSLALAEAWAWLEAQGLIIPAPDQGHGTSYRVLSRRARRFQSEAEFANYAVARMLPREALHSKIADRSGWRSCAENSMSRRSKQ